jgi:hypothetical protein
MISKLMWLKWKAGFKKDESPFIQKSMDEYENSLMRTSTEDLKIMLDLLYDEMDAKVAEENEKKERKRQLKEARDKRRKEIEDRIIEVVPSRAYPKIAAKQWFYRITRKYQGATQLV